MSPGTIATLERSYFDCRLYVLPYVTPKNRFCGELLMGDLVMVVCTVLKGDWDVRLGPMVLVLTSKMELGWVLAEKLEAV